MGVYISGLEIPPKGKGAVVILCSSGAVYSGGQKVGTAVPVPPHGRLGDLDKLEQMFADIDNAPYSGFDGSEPFYSAEDAAQIIRLSPTVIPAEEGE